jgi:hypothetical protein
MPKRKTPERDQPELSLDSVPAPAPAAPQPEPASGLRLAAAGGWPLFGLLKGKMTIAPDFDEPLEAFRPYME